MSCDKAIKINPEFAGAWSNKGLSLRSLKKYKEAVSCYDEVIRIDPNFENIWYNKGWALHFLNKKEESQLCFDKVNQLNNKKTVNFVDSITGINSND